MKSMAIRIEDDLHTQLTVLADRLAKSGYGIYLKGLLAEKGDL